MVLESCANESTRKAPPHISPKTAGRNETPSDFKKMNTDGQKSLSTLLMKPKRKSKGAFNEIIINPILHCP